MDEVTTRHSRPLDSVYPVIYLDALWTKIRDDGTVRDKAIYLALGINLQGEKELSCLWVSQNEKAKFWLQVLTELKNRGVQDLFIAGVDGLPGFEEAIRSIFPQTQVRLCIVHMVRNSLKYGPTRIKKPLRLI